MICRRILIICYLKLPHHHFFEIITPSLPWPSPYCHFLYTHFTNRSPFIFPTLEVLPFSLISSHLQFLICLIAPSTVSENISSPPLFCSCASLVYVLYNPCVTSLDEGGNHPALNSLGFISSVTICYSWIFLLLNLCNKCNITLHAQFTNFLCSQKHHFCFLPMFLWLSLIHYCLHIIQDSLHVDLASFQSP